MKLADIAEKSGVSIVTVSNALAGRSGVSDEMRARIIACADELGYRREKVKVEVQEEMLYIAVLTSEEKKSLLGNEDLFMGCLREEAVRCSVTISTGFLRSRDNGHAPDISWLSDRRNIVRTDGILVLGELPEKSLRSLADYYKVPVVGYGFANPRVNLDFVMDDGFRAMRRVVRHLFELGHRDLIYVSEEVGHDRYLVDRLLGFWNALYEYGLIESVRIPELMRNPEYGTETLLRRIQEGKLPDAVVCSSDERAASVVALLEGNSLRVPGDISVTGYRAGRSEESGEPYFSSCLIRLDLHAARCLELLRRRITKGGSPDGICPLENEFICGKSTGAHKD